MHSLILAACKISIFQLVSNLYCGAGWSVPKLARMVCIYSCINHICLLLNHICLLLNPYLFVLIHSYQNITQRIKTCLKSWFEDLKNWILVYNPHPIFSLYFRGEKLPNIHALSLYSIITPFDAFEISCIWKYYGKWSICSWEQMRHFP